MTDKTPSPLDPSLDPNIDEGDALVKAVDDAAAADTAAEDRDPVVMAEPDRQAPLQPEPPLLPPEVPPMRSAPAAKPSPQRSGWLGAVVGGVLAAAAGYGLAQFVPDGWPIADTSALEAQVAAQAAELATVQAELARVSELASTPQPMPDSGLADRVAALEAAPVGPDLSAEVAALTARLAAIESMPAGDGTGVSTAALAALQADIAALKGQGAGVPAELAGMVDATEARLAEVQSQAATLAAQSEALLQAANTRAALGQLRAALDSGAPFSAALTQLGEVEIPTVLAENATGGLPSLTALQDAFPDAARAALEASLRADMGESWTERVASYLRNQTGARSLTPREGTDPDAVLSRAEAALDAGDLGTTLAELSALPPAGLLAMADWQQLAGTRQSAVQAVAALSEALGE